MAAKPNKRMARAAGAPGRAAAKRTTRKRDTDLDLRRAPLQSRGQATFDHILDATARLLDQLGLEGVNTNTIAKAASMKKLYRSGLRRARSLCQWVATRPIIATRVANAARMLAPPMIQARSSVSVWPPNAGGTK